MSDDAPKTNRKLELIGGLTTFLTMSYIVAVNPFILSDGTGLAFDQVATATILAAAFGSIAMGLFARLPYALAPGMGINAFFAVELIKERKIPSDDALGLVVLSGIVFLVLSATPLRRMIARAIPESLREAVAGGIGIFLAFIGLKASGLIVLVEPNNPVAWRPALGELGAKHALFALGLVVAAALYRAKKSYAFVVAIGGVTILAVLFSPEGADAWVRIPESLVAMPDFGLFGQADPAGALQVALLPPLLTLLFTDLFDSLSTFLGVAKAANLVDEQGEPLGVERALLVDASATFVSGITGTSPATTYIESTAGIEAGGRTGMTAVVAGVAFLPLLFFAPVLGMIPTVATGPVLVIVGALMARTGVSIGKRPFEELLPAFVALIMIPLSFSITNGILLGLALHPILFAFAKRIREVTPMQWALFAIALGLLTLEQLS